MRHGISEATFYNWKAKYTDMTVLEARWLKELEQENAKLKRQVLPEPAMTTVASPPFFAMFSSKAC